MSMAIALDLDSLEWQTQAACRDSDPYWFFQAGGQGDGYEAKRICRRCPVIIKCLDYAVSMNIEFGVFGGMNSKERKRERARRRDAARDEGGQNARRS